MLKSSLLFKKSTISRINNSRIVKINAKFSEHCFYMNLNIQRNFQICTNSVFKSAFQISFNLLPTESGQFKIFGNFQLMVFLTSSNDVTIFWTSLVREKFPSWPDTTDPNLVSIQKVVPDLQPPNNCHFSIVQSPINHLFNKTVFRTFACNFFAQQIEIDKVHHRKSHEILYMKNCKVNLSKFFLGTAKILQNYKDQSKFNIVSTFVSNSFFIRSILWYIKDSQNTTMR